MKQTSLAKDNRFSMQKSYSHDLQYSRIENVLVLPDTNGEQASHAVVTDRNNVRMDREFMPIKLVFLNVFLQNGEVIMSHLCQRKRERGCA